MFSSEFASLSSKSIKQLNRSIHQHSEQTSSMDTICCAIAYTKTACIFANQQQSACRVNSRISIILWFAPIYYQR